MSLIRTVCSKAAHQKPICACRHSPPPISIASAAPPCGAPGGTKNPAAFKAPATGTYGNLGVNSIRGPGMLQFDMGVSRLFTVHERKTLEFRWEVFNVLNRLNPSNPGTAINVDGGATPVV